MAFLLIGTDKTSVINKVGENIYIKNYPSKQSSRAISIAKSKYNDYAASINDEGKVQLVFKNSLNKIIYLDLESPTLAGNALLEDTDNSYRITNISLLSGKKNYLFYSALNPYENTADLIFHTFDTNSDESPQALLSLPNLKAKYQCTLINNKLYIMATIINEGKNELNIYTYDTITDSWEEFETLIISEFPITDFCFCIKDGITHIAYVIEKYGHSTLYYDNSNNNDANIKTEIKSAGKKIKPIIFIYNDVIWINYLTSSTLYSSFSCNNLDFSEPSRCTVQNNSILEFNLGTSVKGNHLYGNHFLGYIDNYPKVAVLSQVDIDNVLFYSNSNKELKGMIQATLSSSQSTSSIEALQEEIENLKEVQCKIIKQYNELADFTKQIQAEGKKWRKKYQRATKELRLMKTAQQEEKKEEEAP